jgi:hypothetical protein
MSVRRGDHNVEQALTQGPRKSVKFLSQQPNFGASSTYRITGEDEKLFPYKIQLQQAFHGANIACRVDFYGDLKDVSRGQSSSTLKHTV